jgi:hypothetical protein
MRAMTQMMQGDDADDAIADAVSTGTDHDSSRSLRATYVLNSPTATATTGNCDQKLTDFSVTISSAEGALSGQPCLHISPRICCHRSSIGPISCLLDIDHKDCNFGIFGTFGKPHAKSFVLRFHHRRANIAKGSERHHKLRHSFIVGGFVKIFASSEMIVSMIFPHPISHRTPHYRLGNGRIGSLVISQKRLNFRTKQNCTIQDNMAGNGLGNRRSRCCHMSKVPRSTSLEWW